LLLVSQIEEAPMLERFTWFRQSAYRWDGDGLTVYIDPWQSEGGPADLILLTHAHFDHYQPDEIERLRKQDTRIVAPHDIARELGGDITAVAPGDSVEVAGVKIQAVPAYNINEERLEAHPKANRWVGYLVTLGEHTYYHAGDTDHLPELESVRANVTFLPIGGDPYTMNAQEAGNLARAISPDLAVPMHYGFVVGSPAEAERFAQAAAPVPVQTLDPRRPFEQQ
jgi:L-ascorbate metabolism protein UlaG (beta-lactamase superfamily)